MTDLTDNQQGFVEEYLIDLNATQAYIRAGFSAELANTNAVKLLQNTTIAKAIAEAQAKREDSPIYWAAIVDKC